MPAKVAAWWHGVGTNDWAPFPDWAMFFLGLGSTIASLDEGPSRSIVAITTPTRAFAAALCAVGIVLGRSKTRAFADPAAHFAFLRTLAIGTAVSFRAGTDGSRKSKATLRGFETREDVDYVVLQVPGRGTRLVPSALAHRIEPLATVPKNLPRHAMFTRVNMNADLISRLLGPAQVDAFITHSRLDCVVVGNRRLLLDELVDAPFAISTEGGRRVAGNLQDVMRARAFLGDGDTYRSDVVSVAARVLPARLASTPAVAIFDGSRSFLRWSRSYPSASWIIVLDRSDRRLTEAIEMIDGMYASRAGDGPPMTVKNPPIGIECAVFAARSGTA